MYSTEGLSMSLNGGCEPLSKKSTLQFGFLAITRSSTFMVMSWWLNPKTAIVWFIVCLLPIGLIGVVFFFWIIPSLILIALVVVGYC